MRSKLKASTSLCRPNFAGVRLHIEYIHTSRIWAPRRQTRGHKQTQVRELAGSIEKNGFNVPLLVDHDLGLISGHARLEAAKMVELERVM